MDCINIKDAKWADLGDTLKKMWELLDKVDMTPEEATFYNKHLHVIRNYYSVNSDFWNTRKEIPYGSNRVKTK